MNYLIVENGIIINIIVCENDEIAAKFGAILSYDGAMIGDKYSPPGPIPSKLREEAYNTEKLIDFNNQSLTVTEASQLWQYYAAEGSSKTNELQVLISSAKSSIREKYPD